MPHLFLNRPRLYDLTRDQEGLPSQYLWETINAIFYKVGGLVFIAGSILFFPAFSKYADLGAWTFFAGSLLYLVVTSHDMAEVHRHWRTHHTHTRDMALEYAAAASYLWGTILFTVGSIFFLSYVDWIVPGAWCFVIGSMLFVLGACINVMQIIKADTMAMLQLMNYTAVTFVAGSILFTVASVPYLWRVDIHEYEVKLHAFLAWQYLIGSVLFFVGGVFNYWRIYLNMRRQIRKSRAD
ncbi:MAG: YrhK family protein [Oceanidesulfovibrio sp.]